MLETLRQYDRKEVERILSSLTSELLPNPGIYIRAELGVEPDLHSRVWREIRRRVKVDPSDASPAGRGKLFEFLFTEMSQIALPRSELDSVKAKLSSRGELRSDLYDVQFSNPAFEVSKAHGVRPNHVLEAVRNANDSEHLNMFGNQELISFFLRTPGDFPSSDPFALLVLARRVGAGLQVHDAFRVYLSDVDLSTAQRPTQVLQLLANKYGFLITIGHITSKLILNEIVTIEGPLEAKKILKVHALDGAQVFADVLVQKLRLHNSYGVSAAFALDEARYAADLRKHGVKVEKGDYRTPVIIFS